ncbi:MAG: outer membrane beta-barrel protein [Saprospiraceae bacterium]
MKKQILLASLFLATFITAKAQDFKVGFQVSPSWSWMKTDETYINPNGSVLGLKLGAVTEYYFRDNYALTAGLGFAFNSGGKLLYDYEGRIWTRTELDPGLENLPAKTTFKYNLQYVEVPFGLKMKTREFGYIRYFAEIPIITLGFKSQARGTLQAVGIDETEKLNIKKEVNSIALSWGVGAGLEYSISQNTALIGGLYFQQSFTDITDDNGTLINKSGTEIANDSKGTIQAITLRLGVMF